MLGVDRQRHPVERERTPSSESGRARSHALRSPFLETPGDRAREREKLRRPGLAHRGCCLTLSRSHPGCLPAVLWFFLRQRFWPYGSKQLNLQARGSWTKGSAGSPHKAPMLAS